LTNRCVWVYLLLVGKNASSDGGAIVATPADEHDSVVERMGREGGEEISIFRSATHEVRRAMWD